MSQKQIHISNEDKSREELIKELDELKVQFSAKEQVCRELEEELSRMRSIQEPAPVEEKLRESEHRHQEMNNIIKTERDRLTIILENLPVGVWIADQKGQLIGKNKAADKIWGGNAPLMENVQDYSQYNAWFADSGIQLEQEDYPMAKALRTGQSVEPVELNIHRFDGTEGTVLVSASPILNDQGRVSGVIGINLDITGRKQAEQALRESEECFRTMADGLPLIVWVHDAEGRQQFVNRTFLEFFGVTDKEMKGGRWQLFVHPDDRMAYANKFSASIRDRLPFHAQVRVQQADGEWRWIESWARPRFSPLGEFLGYVGTSADITERKQTEQALQESELFYRQTLDSIPGMVFTTRSDGYCDYQNQEWVNYTGVPMSEHLGDGWNKLLHPKDQSRALSAWRAAVEGKASYDLEYRVRRKDGIYQWFKVIGRPICDDEGQIIRWFGVLMNIEERKQFEKELRQLNATLEQRVAEGTAMAEARAKQLQSLAVELIEAEERERGQFAHLLHDDLQQMLAAANMQLQLVSDKLPNEPAVKAMGNILVETIAKARRLSHELSPPVLHHSGIAAALQWLSDRMSEQFDLIVEIKANVEPLIEHIPLKTFLFRAVQELLFNIVKHAGVKKARIVLSGSDTTLSIYVSDQGQGFNPDILNDSINKSGFGLITIRERAGYIGGSLTIDSMPGKGSSFTLTVPFSIMKDNESLQKPQALDRKSQDPEVPAVSTSGKIRVLFADDHDVIRHGLIKLVSGQPDIEVVGEAANGKEAVEKALHLRPDVVVMDVSMPEMNGAEAIRCIKTELPEIRVIGLSMYEEKEIIRTMIKAGAESFVSKSASSGKLLKAIYGIDHENK
jgi:PAS domain S-box-containing protein